MKTASTNKLKIKDIITVVLLALINVMIFFASSLLYATPITIIFMPVFFSLLEGVIYFIIGTKVKKPGAFFIYSVVRAIMGGYLPYILLFILSGVIAELLLWKIGYGNGKAKLHHQSSVCRFWKHRDSLRHCCKSHGRSGCVRRPSG